MEFVKQTTDFKNAVVGTIRYASARCPSGKVAIGGGVLAPNQSYGITFDLSSNYSHDLSPTAASDRMGASPHVIGSYPNAAFGFASTDWVVQFEIPVSVFSPGSWPVEVVAVCAKIN